MELDEIEKLKAKVEKDHSSKLFLPLAEEYRKAGMLDEAIAAIKSGLEHQPGYTSARVALGRIYFEKGMLNEAKAEFESIIPVIPDNLFAHKKLAEIYKETGETDKALSEYRLVLSLSPNDEESIAYIEKQGGGVATETEPKTTESGPAQQSEAQHEMPHELSDGPELGALPGAAAEPLPEQQPLAGKDFDEFKSFFAEDTLSATSNPDIGHPDTSPDTAADFSFDIAPDITSDTANDIETGTQNFEDFLSSAVEVPQEPLLRSASDFMEEAIQKTALPEMQEVVPEVSDISTIDSFVAGGDYNKALEAYKLLLVKEPENRHVLQRMSELKSFLKMTGKGDDALVGKLEAFLEAIKQNSLKKTSELSGSI